MPPAAAGSFHSKLDKRDTRAGWADVANTARERVPYSGLLYQRYVGVPHLLNIPEIHALRGTLVSVDPCRLTS